MGQVRRGTAQPSTLDPFGGAPYRSTGWGNGGGGQSFRPIPSALPRAYTPGGTGRYAPPHYPGGATKNPLPARGRPAPATIRRPPVQQPRQLPDRPLPRGFNRPPQPVTPRGAGPKPGRFPKGTKPPAATPKGFGQPRVNPTPSPVPQTPQRFDPFRPEPIKPAQPSYKPMPRHGEPGGVPIQRPSPNDVPGLSTPNTIPRAPRLGGPSQGSYVPQSGDYFAINGYFRGISGGIEGPLSGTSPGIVYLSIEFHNEYTPSYLNSDLKYWVWGCYTHFSIGLGRTLKGFSGYVTTVANNEPQYGITSITCTYGCDDRNPNRNYKEPLNIDDGKPFGEPPRSFAPVAPPPLIPDTIPPNLPDIYPGLPDPDYPDVPDDAPAPPDPIEPDPEPESDPDPEEAPSPQVDPAPDVGDGDGDIEPHLPPPIDPDPLGDDPEFPWKSPDPVPDPDFIPTPKPDPGPTPNPDPKPIPLPVPIPIPGPDPGPTPSPDPKPIPLPVPIPIPGPDPGPTPSPDPKPIPLPVPIPIPGPDPGLTPSPDPKPIPLPVPIPIPGPDPGPTPSPNPRPSPIPGDPGSPDGPGNPSDPGGPTPSDPDPYRPQPFDPKPPPPFFPEPPSTPPRFPRLPLPPSLPPFFDDDPKEPNPVDPYSPPDFIPLPKPPSGGQCKNNACLQSIEDSAQGAKDKAAENAAKLDKLSNYFEKFFQILDVELLIVINEKLGPKIPGGLSPVIGRIEKISSSILSTVGVVKEKLEKFAKWSRLGQLVNVLTFIATIHNAYMLSNSLGQTFLSMLSNGLAVFGIKDDNGNPYDLGSLINKSVEETVKAVVGEANYTTMSAEFKKANRIYQATANLLFSIQSLRFSIMGALETIGSWNARIGNALRRWGAVGESSYGWMNPSPNFDNKFTQAIQKADEVVSQVDSVASEVLSAQETVTQIGTQKDELLNSLGLGTEKPLTENKPEKDKATASKAVSVSPNIESTDLVNPGV
jgi:hypothetical protein